MQNTQNILNGASLIKMLRGFNSSDYSTGIFNLFTGNYKIFSDDNPLFYYYIGKVSYAFVKFYTNWCFVFIGRLELTSAFRVALRILYKKAVLTDFYSKKRVFLN
jgi:hypothetical protein